MCKCIVFFLWEKTVSWEVDNSSKLIISLCDVVPETEKYSLQIIEEVHYPDLIHSFLPACSLRLALHVF